LPFAWAAYLGQIEHAEFLLARGAKPNLPDDKPWTIDHWSVIGLLPAQASKGFEKTMLRDDGHLSQYSWSG
jgi:ankyrin repeat protein